MDDRLLMGMQSNMARAVMITGDAEMEAAGSGKKIAIGAGPWRGEYLPEQAVGLITSRYLLQARRCRRNHRRRFSRDDLIDRSA
jgi:hypothetical protein